MARDYNVRLHTHLEEGEYVIIQERWRMKSLDWCDRWNVYYFK